MDRKEKGKLEYVEVNWIKNDLSPGCYKVTFTFIDSKKNPYFTILFERATCTATRTRRSGLTRSLLVSAIVYKDLTSKATKRIKQGLKTIEFKDTGWREHSGKKFLCYSTKKDLTAAIIARIKEGFLIEKERDILLITIKILTLL